jgi:hydroxymethylpyrimidine/phosphomethylpyrimidine kinase
VAAIDALDLPVVVVDPVLASSSGQRLLDADGVQALLAELLPRARVVTPNLPEAEALSGRRIRSGSDLRRAAQRLSDIGARAVIVTGGHGKGPEVVDLLYENGRFTELRTKRIRVGPVRGTGCTFASAVAAGLALGRPLAEAARQAQLYVAGAIAHASRVGRGARVLDHFWQMEVHAAALLPE